MSQRLIVVSPKPAYRVRPFGVIAKLQILQSRIHVALTDGAVTWEASLAHPTRWSCTAVSPCQGLRRLSNGAIAETRHAPKNAPRTIPPAAPKKALQSLSGRSGLKMESISLPNTAARPDDTATNRTQQRAENRQIVRLGSVDLPRSVDGGNCGESHKSQQSTNCADDERGSQVALTELESQKCT